MSGPDDADDWAKDSCGCGHARYRHNHGGNGPCTATVQRVSYEGLPEPEYAPLTEEHPFAWPTNWPPLAELPVTEQPCGCQGFHDFEPPEPDEDMR